MSSVVLHSDGLIIVDMLISKHDQKYTTTFTSVYFRHIKFKARPFRRVKKRIKLLIVVFAMIRVLRFVDLILVELCVVLTFYLLVLVCLLVVMMIELLFGRFVLLLFVLPCFTSFF